MTRVGCRLEAYTPTRVHGESEDGHEHEGKRPYLDASYLSSGLSSLERR